MNLKTFHIIFVTAATLLAFVMAGWNWHGYGETSKVAYLVTAIAMALGGVGLIVYGFWFWRKITTKEEERRRRRKNINPVPLVFLMLLLSQRAAEACSVCYGDAEGPMIDAARLGVWLLFGMVLLMQGSFVAFFLYLRRKARQSRKEPIPPWWFQREE